MHDLGLDPTALHSADAAFIDEPAGTSTAERVVAAIAAYVWALEWPGPYGPSLDDWRAQRERLRTGDDG